MVEPILVFRPGGFPRSSFTISILQILNTASTSSHTVLDTLYTNNPFFMLLVRRQIFPLTRRRTAFALFHITKRQVNMSTISEANGRPVKPKAQNSKTELKVLMLHGQS